MAFFHVTQNSRKKLISSTFLPRIKEIFFVNQHIFVGKNTDDNFLTKLYGRMFSLGYNWFWNHESVKICLWLSPGDPLLNKLLALFPSLYLLKIKRQRENILFIWYPVNVNFQWDGYTFPLTKHGIGIHLKIHISSQVPIVRDNKNKLEEIFFILNKSPQESNAIFEEEARKKNIENIS